MQRPPGRTYVAIDDDGTIGSAKLHPNQGGPVSHVANASYMVHSAHGRRGIGRTLCEHTIGAARADGYRAIVFNAVAETNVHAVRLYESLGFEALATIPDGLPPPDRRLRRATRHEISRSDTVERPFASRVGDHIH